jgi:cell division protease FtsH
LLSIINKGIAVGESLRIKERVAYHEAGHAVISLLVSPDRGISEVVLEEGQGSDGHVGYQTSSIWHQRPQSKEMVLEDIQVSLAGRIAEQKFVGYIEGIDEGAFSDFRGATDNVWKAITVWGMDDEFGPLTLETCSEISGLKSGFLFDLAQQRLQIIMKENYQITENLVKDNWEHIEVLAKKLLTMNSMSMDEVLLTVPALLKSK